MERFLFSVAAFVSCFTVTTIGAAQDATTDKPASAAPSPDKAADEASASRPKNTLSTNPVRYAILHFQVEYERIASERIGVFVAPIFFHHTTWYPFAPSHDNTATGGGLDLGFRYTFDRAPAGFYVGPILSAYRTEVYRGGKTTLDGYVFSGGAQGGYTWMIDRLLLAGGVGVSYGVATATAPEGSGKASHLPHRGLWVNFRANVGFAF